MTSEEHPEKINWQDLPPNGDEPFDPGFIRFESGDKHKFQRPMSRITRNGIDGFKMPSYDSVREFSRWMAEQIALSERIRKESESIVRCSTTHTMVVMHDGDVVYNKHPDKVVPPATFG